MTWTITTDGDIINVRAVIDTKTEAKQISELIVVLYKHLETKKETPDGQPADV